MDENWALRGTDDVAPQADFAALSVLTPFMGRNAELDHLRRALRGERLVTVHGPSGAGKTALALQVVGSDCGREVVVVRVGRLRSRDHLESELMCALGLADHASGDRMAQIAAHVGERKILIVLDGCELLVTGAGSLTDVVRALLTHGPGVTVLLTSQVVLGIGIEHVVPVGPMPAEDALALLTVQAASRGVTISDSDRAGADRICALVGRLPGPLVFAASWLTVQSIPEALAQARTDPTVLLDATHPADEHHQCSMRIALDRTAMLLTEEQRRLWSVLAHFGDGARQEAIASACVTLGVFPGLRQVVTVLGALIDRGLITRTEDAGVSRYSMHALARLYGQGMRWEDLNPDAIRAAHAQYYADEAARAAVGWLNPGEVPLLRAVVSQRADLDAAAAFWFETGHPQRGLGMLVDTARTRAHVYAARLRVLADSLADGLARHPADPSDVQVTALGFLAWVKLAQGEPATGRQMLTRAHDLSAQLGGTAMPVLTFVEGAYAALAPVDAATATASVALLDSAAAAMSAPTDRFGVSLLATLAEAVHGDPARAVERSAEVLAIAETAGAPWATTWAHWTRALTLVTNADYTEAAHHLGIGLEGQRDCGDLGCVCGSLWLAAVILAPSNAGDAARLFGAAERCQRRHGVCLHSAHPLLKLRVLAMGACRRKLGVSAYNRAIAAGAELIGSGVDGATTLALSALDSTRRARPLTGSPAAVLTPREHDVVALVTDGLTYKEIGSRLHVSARTVETYIGRAASKAGVCGRVELVAWFLGSADTVA
ncbi:Predicted ATPase [Actinokineospora alba]|uniref:Predicted ATPase n=1 Tax=Actinokineospora alba TaxID=504798 RepID=A0A1H0UEM5_9PSEU|nr:LuxR C-terminal-related transcriptional regulator [Actinokineospora alba]TDP65151.1 putative ATPase [Actinokineospora alba]SDH55313.1 Predicted ATPase [Actinokineospora alba]SDP64581.1 Predicted ATPase [Actinokineospora alba]